MFKMKCGFFYCAGFDGDVNFFFFRLEITFFSKFSPKSQNCLIEIFYPN